jgi:hypothetical protein
MPNVDQATLNRVTLLADELRRTNVRLAAQLNALRNAAARVEPLVRDRAAADALRAAIQQARG